MEDFIYWEDSWNLDSEDNSESESEEFEVFDNNREEVNKILYSVLNTNGGN